MLSVHDLFRNIVSEYPKIDRRHLRVLISHSMKSSMESLLGHPETIVSENMYHEILVQVQKLLEGVPLSRLLGKREFWGMDFQLSSETLDPRPDSETLVEAVLKHKTDRKEILKILDLGTGTGCLIISLLKEYLNAQGLAIDQSSQALETAAQNACIHGVSDRLTVHRGNWFEGVSGLFDVIISNPPYISNNDYNVLEDNVKNYDPPKALIAGEDGLDDYKNIIPAAPQFLKKQGILVFEVGQGQREEIEKLMRDAGFNTIHIYKDLGGIERCLVGERRIDNLLPKNSFIC